MQRFRGGLVFKAHRLLYVSQVIEIATLMFPVWTVALSLIALYNPDRFLCREREFFIDNLLVRIHLIIVMIRWTGPAPWKFEFPFPGSLTSTFPDLNPNP